ncbi:hypothetical protein F3Y22_tig00110324pilonHSYRG00052 [Hibiscus syriacus]|uniref:Survival protein SurE-like phosphatase/nucleotidase domain-containing protein n=1 Tax=Hibiscus syriacus TaxID=106335 RepID=A0A6A3B4U1_HIBSY|nr:hypothetical protein F3Y22_tig00110324pilonHSYRG00052 [Hibiscus syriacus]
MTTMKKNMLPPGLVNNLQEVLSKKGGNNNNVGKPKDDSSETSTSSAVLNENDSSKPVVLVTNGEGVDSLGLVYLVQALVGLGPYSVNVCAPQSDKSISGHSVTVRETITVARADIDGAIAYEVSGTPVDCVSLALSGALFSWSKPLLVISGINRGSSCGHHMYHSGVVAGAREALISGVPSLSLSLNWKREESQEDDLRMRLPFFTFNKGSHQRYRKGITSLSPLQELTFFENLIVGFKLTKQSMWRSTPCWQAVSANRHPSAAHFMSNQQSLGLQLAQLGRDASVAGAARRGTAQSKNEEVESVGAAKSDTRVKKYFRLEFVDKETKDTDEDLDFQALNDGFIAVTPLSVSLQLEPEVQTAASSWISGALSGVGEQ